MQEEITNKFNKVEEYKDELNRKKTALAKD